MTSTNVVSSEELWRDVPNYEGYYQVSSLGRIKSLHRIVMCGPDFSVPKEYPESFLTPRLKRGYLSVTFCIKGKMKAFSVHRLMALAFLPNPDNKPLVDHENGIKTANFLSNLRWATRVENARNPNTFDNTLQAMDKAQSSRWRAVSQIDPSTNKVVANWKSLADASRKTGFSFSAIWSCCNGIGNSLGGYHWEYIVNATNVVWGWVDPAKKCNGKNPNFVPPVNKGSSRAILQIDLLTGKVLGRFDSTVQAAKVLNLRRGGIGNCLAGKLKTSGGYVWKYA